MDRITFIYKRISHANKNITLQYCSNYLCVILFFIHDKFYFHQRFCFDDFIISCSCQSMPSIIRALKS